MIKSKKLILALVAVCSALLVALPQSPLGRALAYVETCGNYKYDVDTIGQAYVYGFSGSSTSTVAIPSMENGKPVVGISANAFMNKTSITKVILPDSVTSIGNNAFSSCTSLESVEIQGAVTSIGDYAFQYCSALTGIDLPEGLLSIGRSAFFNSGLRSISLPSSLTDIGPAAFQSTRSAQGSVAIPEGVTVLPYAAFAGSGISSVTLHENLTSIGNGAFSGTEVRYVTLPDSVTSLGSEAFKNCPLQDIKLSAGLTEIPENLFNGCDILTELTIPEGVTTMPANALSGMVNLQTLNLPSTLEQVQLSSLNLESLEIPDGPTTVTLSNLTSLAALTLPETATSLTLSGLSALEAVKVPDSVGNMSIRYWTPELHGTAGGYAQSYADANGLRFVDIDAVRAAITYTASDTGVTVTGFNADSVPARMNLPAKLDGLPIIAIGERAFYNCAALESIGLPEGLTSIGSMAFSGCSALQAIEMPDGVRSVGDQVCYGCASLTRAVWPASATTIGFWAFADCPMLESLTIPEGVTLISDGGFISGCTRLRELTIPSTMTSLNLNSAYVTDLTLPETLTSATLYSLYDIETLNLPASATRLTIQSCPKLEAVNLQEGLKEIYATDCPSLLDITVPNTAYSVNFSENAVTRIHADASGDVVKYLTDFYPIGRTDLQLRHSNDSILAQRYLPEAAQATLDIPEGVTGINENLLFRDTDYMPEMVVLPASFKEDVQYSLFSSNDIDVTVKLDSYAYLHLTISGYTNPDLYLYEAPGLKVRWNGMYSAGSAGLDIVGYEGTEPDLVIPDSSEKALLNTVKPSAFAGNEVLESVVFPASFYSIGGNAFQGCPNLERVTLPGTINYLDAYAFADCPKLADIALPQGLTVIHSGLFMNDAALTAVTIPSGVSYVDQYAFYGCSALALSVPGSLTDVRAEAFTGVGELIFQSAAAAVAGDAPRANPGESAQFSATAYNAQSVRWEMSDDGETWTAVEDAAANALTVEVTEENLARQYRLVALGNLSDWGNVGYSTSRAASPYLRIDAQPQDADAPMNSAVTLSLTAAGATGWQWQSSDDGLSWSDLNLTGADTAALKLWVSEARADRQYRCLITGYNGLTETSAAATLTANGEADNALALPAALTSIEAEAFAGAAAQVILLPESCASVGARAFADADALRYVVLPNANAAIAADAFEGSDGVTLVADAGSAIEAYASANGLAFLAR